MNELKHLLEAFIFASDAPLSLDRLSALMERPRADLRPFLEELAEEYRPGRRGFYLAEIAGGYQFRTDAALAPWLRKLSKERPFRLSRAALETLAIVAYRQPVTRAEVEKNLLRILGKKDIPGRPLMYGTSRQFLELFGLRDLNDLPTLKDFAALAPELEEAVPLDPEMAD